MPVCTNLSHFNSEPDLKGEHNILSINTPSPLPAIVANLSVEAIISTSRPYLQRTNSQSMLLDLSKIKYNNKMNYDNSKATSSITSKDQLKNREGISRFHYDNLKGFDRYSLPPSDNTQPKLKIDKSTRTSILVEKYGEIDRRSIGTGATSTVRLSHKKNKTTHGVNQTLFAIKRFIPRKENQTERSYLKRIISEFCIGSSLSHPNIVKVLDLVQDEEMNTWCQVMEYCPNGDLFSLINKKPIPLPQAKTLFKQLISGVNYLHETGVVHRDLKPENLLLDSNFQLKITDFGSSEVIIQPWKRDIIYPCSGASGSLPYIAPESFEEADFDGRKADVWSCGIIYYHMVIGDLPWKFANSKPRFIQSLEKYLPKDLIYCQYVNLKKLPNFIPDGSSALPLHLLTKLLNIEPNCRPLAKDILEQEPFFN